MAILLDITQETQKRHETPQVTRILSHVEDYRWKIGRLEAVQMFSYNSFAGSVEHVLVNERSQIRFKHFVVRHTDIVVLVRHCTVIAYPMLRE